MSPSVLVVDDDRQMVKTIRAILDHRGWESTAAYSGEEAVAVGGGAPLHAVLMDVRMTGINGVEACQAIHAAQPEMPVILMTAYAAQEICSPRRGRSGVVTIMPKPLPWPKLMAHLDGLMHGCR